MLNWTQPTDPKGLWTQKFLAAQAAMPPDTMSQGDRGGPNHMNSVAIQQWLASPQGQQYNQLLQEGQQNGYIQKDAGFGAGLRDAFLNPATLAAAGGIGLQAAGVGAFGGGASAAAPAAGYGVMPGAAAAAGGATGGLLSAGGAVAPAVAGGALTAGGAVAPTAAGAAPWWQSAIGPVAGSLVGGGLSLYGANSAANKLSDAANNAADKSKFTPYNVFSGAGSGTFNGTTATGTLSPEYLALRNKYLQNANGNLNALQNYDPQAAANDVYGKLSALSNPQEEQDRLNQENRLLAQGMLGSTGGGIQRQALLTSQGLAGVGRQVQSYQLGQDALNQMQNRAFGATNAATALDAIPMNNLNAGGVFGGRASQANQFGTGLQYNAASAGAGASASFWQGLGQQVAPGVSSAVNNYYQQNPWGGSPYVPPTQTQANNYYGGLWTGN